MWIIAIYTCAVPSPQSLRELDPLWTREMRERWRRPWTFVLLLVYAAALATLARVFYGALVPQGDVEFSKLGLGLGAPLFWKFVACQIAGWVPLGLLLAAPSLAIERERGALTDYLLAGLGAEQVVRAKWRSLAGFALVLVVAPLPVAALCFPMGGVSAWDFVAANALCVSVALSSCALGLVLSAKHNTVSGAFVEAVKACVEVSLLAVPLAFLLPSLAPGVLLVGAVGLAFLPRSLLRHIEAEFAFLGNHLELDARRLPDYQAPSSFSFGQNSLGERVPLLTPDVTAGNNAAQAEGAFDPPPSRFDLQLEQVVARNPLARRDVGLQLRAWRRSLLLSDSDPLPKFSPLSSLGVGVVLVAIGYLVPPMLFLFLALFWMATLGALVQTALLSANGFARERSGHMITQLQLSALSSAEVVSAKFVTPLLLVARFWGYPLLILALSCLPLNPLEIGLKILVALALLVLASALGNLMSLRLRHISLIAGATVGALVVLLGVLPMVFQPLLLHAPRWLELWWLAPLRALLWVRADSLASPARLFVSLSVLCLLLFGACVRGWKRARDESR